jgi:hypothetical protein
MSADYTFMGSIQNLWDRFHLAREERNVDAALCFRRAIEAATRADSLSADWWRLQAEMCESVAAYSPPKTLAAQKIYSSVPRSE